MGRISQITIGIVLEMIPEQKIGRGCAATLGDFASSYLISDRRDEVTQLLSTGLGSAIIQGDVRKNHD